MCENFNGFNVLASGGVFSAVFYSVCGLCQGVFRRVVWAMNLYIKAIKRAFGCRVGSVYSREDLIDIADVAVTQHVQYPHNMDLEECVRIAVSAVYEEIKNA